MERNISAGGLVTIVLVAVASVVGVSYASFAITKDTANTGNQEVVTQTQAVSTSWSETYNGKKVTGNQVLNLLNDADSKGISVFVSTRGIEKQLTTSVDTPVLKHNDKYYVNYGATYNYEDASYGYVNGEVKYDGNSSLLKVRDSQSLKTDYSPKYSEGNIVKNKDFSAVYTSGTPTFIESSAKFDANLIYGVDGEVTGVILSQATSNTAATLSVNKGSSSSGGGNSTNAPIISKPSSTSGSVGNIPIVVGGSGGSSSKPNGSTNSGSTGGDSVIEPGDTPTVPEEPPVVPGETPSPEVPPVEEPPVEEEPEAITGREYVLLDGSGMSFVVGDNAADLLMNGNIIMSLDSTCISTTEDTMTISNTGVYDGTYNFCDDGYVEMYGQLVAKDKEKWVTLGEDGYLIVHNGEVYESMDGNIPVNYFASLDELGTSLTEFIDLYNNNGIQCDLYPFAEYNGVFKLSNIYDILAMTNLASKGIWYNPGFYDMWGGTGKDYKEGNSFIQTGSWQSSNVQYRSELTIIKAAGGNKKVNLNLNSVINDATYIMETKEAYYYDGMETDNIFIVEDYPFYYEDGMTHRDWLASKYTGGGCLGDWTGMYYVYIEECALDNLCGEYGGYMGGSRPLKVMNYVYCSAWDDIFEGKGGTLDMCYCDGKVTFVHPEFGAEDYLNNKNYTYAGIWCGKDYPVMLDYGYSFDIINAALKDNIIDNVYNDGNTIYLYTAFSRPSSATVVDISSYKTVDGKFDTAALLTDYGIPSDITVYNVAKDDDVFVYFDETTLSNATSNKSMWRGCAKGITFYHNGTYYEYFAN